MEKVFHPISLSRIEPNQFKPEIGTARLKQVVESQYAARAVQNELGFDMSDYALDSKSFNSTRVAFVDVPLAATSNPDMVTAQLAKNPTARIKRILSSKPILLPSDMPGLTNTNPETGLPFNSIDKIAARQQVMRPKLVNNQPIPVKNPDGTPKLNSEGNPVVEVEPWFYNGHPQYKRNVLSLVGEEDVDEREALLPQYQATQLVTDTEPISVEEHAETV